MVKLETGKFLGDNKLTYDADGVIVCKTEYHQKVFEGWHAHANYHVTLILRGGNRERRKNKEFEVAPGSVLFYRSGELHRNSRTLHPSKNINLEVKDSFLSEYQADVPALDSSHQHRADAQFSLLKIYKECQNDDAHNPIGVHSLVLALFDSQFEEKASGKIPPWTIGLREIVNDRWNELPSLNELSRLLGVHPVTISKKFPCYFSCTLGEYVRKIKIEKAVALIGQSRYGLADIAYQCGFADQSHLNRVFKDATEFTPHEFRRF